MRILGIDPGYDRVGWAILDRDTRKMCTLVEMGCIQTSKSNTRFKRYQDIVLTLQTVLNQHQPSAVAIESIFFSKNQKTAMLVSEARGVILATILPFTTNIHEYSPNQIKLSVTGYGSSDKKAVEKMIRLQLKMSAEKVIDDTMDAVAAAFTHALIQGSYS